jgi:hypothetical protein
MSHRLILFLLLGIDALILFYQVPDLSISAGEALFLEGDFSLLQLIINASLSLFGQNDYALRTPMILFHIASALLLYKISKEYINSYRNRLWLLVMFMMLPGVVSSALIVNSAGFLIFGLFSFAYLQKRIPSSYLNILLLLYALADQGFLYLFLSLSVYYFLHQNKRLFLYNISLVAVNISLYGIDIGGFPTGHFLDSIGVYSAILTPIIFIYIFYALYRRYLTNKINIIWYISSTTLIYSLILSFRQQVSLEYYAPYIILSLPLVAQTFISSYRIRLKMFRTGYKVAFIISFVFLFLNFIVVFFNKELYLVLDKPQKHFAYNMHIAKDLAKELRKQGISCVKTEKDMQVRLKFYGIAECEEYTLKENKKNPNVTISYSNKILYSASVTKLNIK